MNIPFTSVGNGELCPFCKKVIITEENGTEHLIKCIKELNIRRQK